MEELLEEARFLAEQGVGELNVIAQDAANYGVDTAGGRLLHRLVMRLSQIDGLRWIRLLYLHPAHVYDELIEVMAGEPKVCRYVDMPLQHISDRILRAMGRGILRGQTEELLERLRDRIPGVALRTTFLTGFPGETEEDFEELLEFVREQRFDRMGCFAYSAEEGTAAAGMPQQVERQVAERRRDALMAAQQEIAFELAEDRRGEITEVLAEPKLRLDEELWPARSPAEAPDVDPLIYVSGRELTPGSFYEVRIAGGLGYDCVAELVAGDQDGS
jgi:ribosomal protein S12 methylthiotransferase